MSLKTILILIGIVVIGLALIYGPKAIRVNKMIHLYDKDKIAYNFINMDKIFRAGPTIKAKPIMTIPIKIKIVLRAIILYLY